MGYGCESAGYVYNPFGAKHGHSHFDINDRRVGDLEHVQGRFDTNAEYKNRDLLANLSGPNSIIGPPWSSTREKTISTRPNTHRHTIVRAVSVKVWATELHAVLSASPRARSPRCPNLASPSSLPGSNQTLFSPPTQDSMSQASVPMDTASIASEA